MPNSLNCEPLISVIINCHNGEKYLYKAIESVYSQTYSNWEIVFWDNASNDDSHKIVEKFSKKIRYFRSEQKEILYLARNHAVREAKGEFITFLDVDDWWEPTKLKTQLEYAIAKKLTFVFSKYYFLDDFRQKSKIINPCLNNMPSDLSSIIKNYRIGLLTLFVEKKRFIELQGFNSEYHIMGDFDFSLRIMKDGNYGCVSKPLATYRWHGNNESNIYGKEKRIRELEMWIETNKSKTFFSDKEKSAVKLIYIYNKALLHLDNISMFLVLLVKVKDLRLSLSLLYHFFKYQSKKLKAI